MITVGLSILAIFLGILMLTRVGPVGEFVEQKFKIKPSMAAKIIIVAGFVGFITRSFVIIDSDGTGHLKRIYLAADLPPGQIISVDGEKGPQADILGPGFHFIPFVRVIYDVEEMPIIEIPDGSLGFVTTKDGKPLREGQFIAEAWQDDQFEQMLDARHFLTEGHGQKGPQLTVLRPGKYRLNRYLFQVKAMEALDVPTGQVAVIRSNVQENENCPDPIAASKGKADANVATPIVPKGCIGVWDIPLTPGRYYLNPKAYVPTIIPTRVQTWAYKGGYTQRIINLKVEDNGSITQLETKKQIPVPKDAADQAINVRVEGWTFPVELRVITQVYPKDAPRVVASVGSIADVENLIVTPAIRDILRTIGGSRDRKVLDFVEKRDELASLLEAVIVDEAKKAGVTIQEVRLGEPAIPPELLVATLRKQLATQLQQTYREEQAAQGERIKVERDRATADQQKILVKAEIEKQAAEHQKTRLKLEGEGEKLKLIEIAKGQKAQVDVLGEDRTLQLQMLKESLAIARDQPDIIKVPMVQVMGSAGGFEGAAAILGASNLVQMMKEKEQGQKVKSK